MQPITPEFLNKSVDAALSYKCACRMAIKSLLKGIVEGKIYFMLQGLWAGVTTQEMEKLLSKFDFSFGGYNFKTYKSNGFVYEVPKHQQAEDATNAKNDKEEETASANSSSSGSDEDSDSDEEPITELSRKKRKLFGSLLEQAARRS